MILSAEQIKKHVLFQANTFREDDLEPCSYRLRVATRVSLYPGTGTFEVAETQTQLIVGAKVCGLILGLPMYMGELFIPPVMLNPEWRGKIAIPIVLCGPNPVVLVAGLSIAQIRFEMIK
jgi:deoxycytidine triphosphate deaminase